jgi:hypothetical protein
MISKPLQAIGDLKPDGVEEVLMKMGVLADCAAIGCWRRLFVTFNNVAPGIGGVGLGGNSARGGVGEALTSPVDTVVDCEAIGS